MADHLDPPALRRRELLMEYRAQARETYLQAVAAGVVLPLILIVDSADPDGRAIVSAAQAMPDHVGIAIAILPLQRALATDGPLLPPWRKALETVTATAGHPEVHIVLVIAAEGCFCIAVPLNEEGS